MKKRKILLIEPNYKNKYPPIGLMKLSTYHKMLGDDVTFFKGNIRDFITEEIYDELVIKLTFLEPEIDWSEYKKIIISYIVKAYKIDLEKLKNISNNPLVEQNLIYYKDFYRKKEYFNIKKWDRVCISTLFTFYWKETIETINFFKKFCKIDKEVWVGGVAASVVPDKIYKETGIKPFEGLLDKSGVLDNNDIIIDELPLDYSILYEIEYEYPENNGYYGYMTRGCINKCSFCAVPKIEPTYKSYIGITEQIKYVQNMFGEKQKLLLLDNNVLASERFFEIIEEIKKNGFAKDDKYIPPNEYEVAIKGLKSGYNDKGYIRHILKLYKSIIVKLNTEKQNEVYSILKLNKLIDTHTAKKEKILLLNDYFSELFLKIYKPKPKIRIVDFNQGIDARLLTEEKAKKMSEISIRPLRIAFDSWKYKKIYEQAIRISSKCGIKNMSNYLLYNHDDKPVELFYRLKLNVELCEELGVNIYSFPMKYHPIQDPKYFKDRSYIGKYWNRKYIRSIQAILNSTKGKIGRGKSFFEYSFGKNEEEFEKLLYMPEAMIIYRSFYKGNGIVDEWWNAFKNLNKDKLSTAKTIIEENDFKDINKLTNDKEILEVLNFYKIKREDAENKMKEKQY